MAEIAEAIVGLSIMVGVLAVVVMCKTFAERPPDYLHLMGIADAVKEIAAALRERE